MNPSNDVVINIVLKGGDKLSQGLNKARGSISRFSGSAKAMGTAFKAIGSGAAVVGGALAAGFGAMVKSGIQVAASLETTEAGFKTLLGNSKKARRAMEMIKKDAIKTPFDTLGLARLNQQLTGVTKDAKRSQKVILDVGEAVIGMGRGTEELDRIIVNLQQIGATGRASMIDIRQFAFAGIPIFEMLKKETGLSGEALNKFVSDGKVSFEMVEKMFDKANNKGGLFFNAYKNNANTFAQKSAELKESWQNFTSDFVMQTGLLDGAKGVIEDLKDAISNDKPDGLGYELKRLLKTMKTEEATKVFREAIDYVAIGVRNLADVIGAVQVLTGQPKDMLKPGAKNKALKGAGMLKEKENQRLNILNPLKVNGRSDPLNLFKGFDSGGIVGGNKYSGDRNLIRANSGEMVINRSQQSGLLNLIKNLGTRPNVNFNGNVNFGGNSRPVQQQMNFVNLLSQLQ